MPHECVVQPAPEQTTTVDDKNGRRHREHCSRLLLDIQFMAITLNGRVRLIKAISDCSTIEEMTTHIMIYFSHWDYLERQIVMETKIEYRL